MRVRKVARKAGQVGPTVTDDLQLLRKYEELRCSIQRMSKVRSLIRAEITALNKIGEF